MRLVTDAAWAIMTIHQETAGEPQAGKLAVARVIRNRMKQRYNSDGTVPGTVLRAYQFSGWNSSGGGRIRVASLDDDDPVVKACAQAWLDSLILDPGVKDAVLYYDPEIVKTPPDWAVPGKFAARIGRHEFYNA